MNNTHQARRLSHDDNPKVPSLSLVAECQLVVETVSTLEQLQALQAEWLGLERRAHTPLPFLTHAWVTAWWEQLAKHKLHVRDSLHVQVVRTLAGELVAIAPMMSTERPSFGPLRARQLQFIGRGDGDITELSGVLCLPAFEAAAHQAVLDDLKRSSRSWDWMLWQRLRRDGAGHQQVGPLGASTGAVDVPNYVLPLAASWEELRAVLPRNIKESLRKCYNSLKREGLTPVLEVAEKPAEVCAALHHFFRLHGARAGMLGGMHHRDVFDTIEKRAFLVETCTRLAEQGRARIFLLKIGEQVVATRIGFAMGECLYLYYSGFDPKFSKYSVMTTTVAEAVKYAITAGFSSVNLSNGNDVSKTRWAPREELYCELVQLSPTPRAKLAFNAFGQARRMLNSLQAQLEPALP